VHAAPTIPGVHEIGRAAEELVFLSVQFLFSTLERREARVKSRFDRDQILIGQRTNPRQVDAFGYDSHLNLLIRHYVAYRPARIFFDEK
jgi:hypothetical protein